MIKTGAAILVMTSLVMLSYSNVDAIAYKDCGSTSGAIVDVSVTNCTNVPCVFVRGNDYSISITFKSMVETKSVENSVYGVISHIPVPFHLPNSDGCTLGIKCPVTNGTTYTESVTMPVKNEYPKISLYVQWEVADDQKRKLACFLFPVSLQ